MLPSLDNNLDSFNSSPFLMVYETTLFYLPSLLAIKLELNSLWYDYNSESNESDLYTHYYSIVLGLIIYFSILYSISTLHMVYLILFYDLENTILFL